MILPSPPPLPFSLHLVGCHDFFFGVFWLIMRVGKKNLPVLRFGPSGRPSGRPSFSIIHTGARLSTGDGAPRALIDAAMRYPHG